MIVFILLLTLYLISCHESRLHGLGITKDKEINKVYFTERVLNHMYFTTQEQNDRML